MSKTITTTSSSGIGFSGLLAVLFIGLKLAGIISWSWVWVLAPIWIPLFIIIGVFLIIGMIAAVIHLKN